MSLYLRGRGKIANLCIMSLTGNFNYKTNYKMKDFAVKLQNERLDYVMQ